MLLYVSGIIIAQSLWLWLAMGKDKVAKEDRAKMAAVLLVFSIFWPITIFLFILMWTMEK